MKHYFVYISFIAIEFDSTPLFSIDIDAPNLPVALKLIDDKLNEMKHPKTLYDATFLEIGEYGYD